MQLERLPVGIPTSSFILEMYMSIPMDTQGWLRVGPGLGMGIVLPYPWVQYVKDD